MLRTSKKLAVVFFVSCFFLATIPSCMSLRVVSQHDSDSPVPEKVTKWNFLWGLIQPNETLTRTTCESICQVNAKTNIGHILISGITFGIVVPMTIEYECCPYQPEPSEL